MFNVWVSLSLWVELAPPINKHMFSKNLPNDCVTIDDYIYIYIYLDGFSLERHKGEKWWESPGLVARSMHRPTTPSIRVRSNFDAKTFCPGKVGYYIQLPKFWFQLQRILDTGYRSSNFCLLFIKRWSRRLPSIRVLAGVITILHIDILRIFGSLNLPGLGSDQNQNMFVAKV